MPKNYSKQFCKYGHDTFVLGRDEWHRCLGCYRPVLLGVVPRKVRNDGICPNGHDRSITGVNKAGRCLPCSRKRVRKHRETHTEEISLRRAEYYQENQEELRAKRKQWIKDHPDLEYKCRIQQETNRNLRVVAWTDWDNISPVVKNRPNGMVVDHYIPLQGKKVSGLHVSWNLQYLTPKKNAKKKNKCNLIEASEWYGKILEKAGLKEIKE